MCGGNAEPFARAAKVMTAYVRSCNLLGPTGAGQLAKIVN
jgi:3-hydroxyisobutyrate dehydrogenase